MSERPCPAWGPRAFRLEPTTVWSFPERGGWATHDGGYRGNWSPYIPRNLILLYTKPGDLVLDPFVGGGTTAIEARLLGRRCIALDLNPAAIARSRTRVRVGPAGHGPHLLVGDARALPVADGTVDLVCAHPPYADAIRYSPDLPGDLSHLVAPAFLGEMQTVAAECRRVLRPGGILALLIGDLRQHGDVVPLGMETFQVLRQAGLVPQEIVIKAQHHTRTAGAWAPVAAARGFLLLAHEYLLILRKPCTAHRPPSERAAPNERR